MIRPVDDVLSGRDERAAVQKIFLSKDRFICQISLNVPGYPKRMTGDEKAIGTFRGKFLSDLDNKILEEQIISNGAGLCWLGVFFGDKVQAKKAKHCAVSLEEGSPCGRIFDIDVITTYGPISRRELGLSSRKCLICNKNAKVCARERTHSFEELRSLIEQILTDF